ncbi:CapA family protein [Reichenbachiella sp. MALMAid0571]|uniref:CapA family protein n=1 Tax=Reichenbachiella sp. MALMAid0571 TaxID=3143939 RepID=UPI0032DFEEB0
MKRSLSIFFYLILLASNTFGQSESNTDTLSLLFIGDIMGHDSQINAAFDNDLNSYDYNSVFEKIKPILQKPDYTIANLEVTLAGPPFKGYPQFSSPDELAVACQNNGIDVLVTSNNHSCDRRKSGIIRTIDVLDSLNILHTGTFRNATEQASNNLLILDKNNIRVGLLNYTYGTNGIPTPSPTTVNRIDWKNIAKDIEASKTQNLDKLIVFLHWGNEYQSQPSTDQVDLANYLFSNGADIIIGSHPHVIQKMEYRKNLDNSKETFIAYSLGNFVSNQRVRKRDGGAMVELTLTKTDKETHIKKSGYHLIWVHKPIIGGKSNFQIISGKEYEQKQFEGMESTQIDQLKVFLEDSRELLNTENLEVSELSVFNN